MHAATDDRCANFSASTCPTHSPLLTASSTADKLPLEKFHRLLDLVFWVKFLKLSSISLFVFFGEFYRVSLNPVILLRACGAPLTRPGGRATLSCSPGPRFAIVKINLHVKHEQLPNTLVGDSLPNHKAQKLIDIQDLSNEQTKSSESCPTLQND